MRSPATGARVCVTAAARRARRRGPALRERLHAFHTQAVRKNYKASTRPPATLPLSPRVLNCPFSLPALNAQLTSSRVIMTIFRVCGNGDYGVCYVSQHEEISTRVPTYRPRFPIAHQWTPTQQPPDTNSPRSASPRGLSIDKDGVTCLSWPRSGTERQLSDIRAST
jgi:hypothetical protein